MDESPYSPPQEAAVFGTWYGIHSANSTDELPMSLTAEEMKRVYRLVDRLKPHNPVRRKAEEFLTRSATKLDSLKDIIASLTRPNKVRWQERQVAVWVLGSAQLQGKQRDFAIETLIQTLEGRLEPDLGERARSLSWKCLFASLVLAVPMTDWSNPYLPMVFSVFTALFAMAVFGQRLVDRWTGIRVGAEAATALGKLQAVKGLDIVVAATQRIRGARGRKRLLLRHAAMAALPAILDAVKPDDEGRFRSDTIQGLCRLLKTGDEPLVLAILQAFAYVGNHQALPDVERLASGDGRAAYEPRVQRAAQQSLPAIRARIARERDPQVLLRGSVVPPAPTDQLLRANPDAAPFDPMQMLRASADPGWKGTEQEINLVLQILQHLQEQGDTRSLAYVEQIASADGLDPRIHAAAITCLPVLQAHLELERYSPKPVDDRNVQAGRLGRETP